MSKTEAVTLIQVNDIPSGDGPADTGPVFVPSPRFYGRDIENRVHKFIVHNLPGLFALGLVKDYTGLGVRIYLPDSTDYNSPWLSYTYDGGMTLVSNPLINPNATLYNQNAARKAQFALRTGLDSIDAVQAGRHLRQPGDFPWAGAVQRDGVCVSVSGLTQDEDHMLAEMLAALVLCEMRKAIDVVDDVAAMAPSASPHYWGGNLTKSELLHNIERKRRASL